MVSLGNFGHNRKRKALTLPVFSNPRRALYKWAECSEKDIDYFSKNCEQKPVPESTEKSAPLHSLSIIYIVFIPN